jgi:hypothetical protein
MERMLPTALQNQAAFSLPISNRPVWLMRSDAGGPTPHGPTGIRLGVPLPRA